MTKTTNRIAPNIIAENNDNFYYRLSHDLHQPIGTAKGFLELLKSNQGNMLDSKCQSYLDFSIQGISTLKLMIDGLLEWSMIPNHKLDLDEFDLNDVLSSVVQSFSTKILISQIKINKGEFPTVNGDYKLFHRMLREVICNAITYCSSDHPMINMSCIDDDDFWRFEFNNQSDIIPDHILPQISQIFYTYNSTEQHIGMGLPFIKAIAEAHGGEIWLDSVDSLGTTLYIRIPKK